MKTEPTEAIRYIMDNEFGDGIMDIEDAEEAVNIAFREGQSSPKTKQLEWDFYGTYYTTSRMEYSIKTPFIIYVITQGDDYNINENEYLLWIDGVSYNFRTLDEAKAAAQADFEARIKKCLITEKK